MQLLPNVYHFDTGPFNWYLVEEGSRLTLIDAGFPGHFRVFQRGLDSIGKSIDDVEAVLLTHSHADHTGFAEKLRREFDIPVFIHRADKESVSRPPNLPWLGLLSNAWRWHIRGMLLHATFNGVFRMPKLGAVNVLEDEQVLDVPGRPHVIHVPGHTPGELAFYLPSRNLLFSGDTLVTLDLMSGRDGGPQLPYRVLNQNDAEARRSIDRLAELGQLTFLPGHGKPWSGEMRQAVEEARGAN